MTAPAEGDGPYKVEALDEGDKIITGPTAHPGVFNKTAAGTICRLLNLAFAAGEKKIRSLADPLRDFAKDYAIGLDSGKEPQATEYNRVMKSIKEYGE